MGGTGLSGLALLDEGWARLLESSASFQLANQTGCELEARATSQTVLIANPITSRIQGKSMDAPIEASFAAKISLGIC